jgi:hypothetical protein
MGSLENDDLLREMHANAAHFDIESQSDMRVERRHHSSKIISFIKLLDGPKDYREFCSQFKSLPVLVSLVFLVVAIFIPLSCMAMVASNYNPKYICCFTLYLLLTVAITVTAITCKGDRECLIERVMKVNEPWVEIFYIYGISITNGIYLMFRVLSGPCANSAFENVWHCNPSLHEDTLPTSHYILITFIPLAFLVLFRSTRWSIHLSAWLISLTFIYVASCLLPVTFSRSWLVNIAYTILGGVLFFEVRRQSIYTYRLHKLLVASTDELAALKEREYADEMRHLIGNVAHDLKTVS